LSNKRKKNIKRTSTRPKKASRPLLSPILRRFHRWTEEIRLGAKKPQVFAYQAIGERIARFLPFFKDLSVNLRRSGIKISFKAYVSFAIFMSMLVSVSLMILIPTILIVILSFPFLSSLLFGLGGSLFAGGVTMILFYAYPIYRADSLKRNLEDGLPFTTGYMSILAGAGVPPDRIFRSLAELDAPLAVSDEAKDIVRDVELFGFDILSALESASDRTPSERFKELLEGFIATVHSGGGLTKYLRGRSRQYMKLKRIALTRFSDVLAILAEFYVTMLVAGPLILVVMLAVMAMLGGGTGLFDPRLLLYLLTYLGIPIGSVMFLIILDAISPRR
jgi:flagellar protein FlaJ